MEELFNRFKNLIELRLNHHGSFDSFGEDSIRYDFYISLMELYNIPPHKIILEQAIPNSQFIQTIRNRELLAQGRHTDKPEFDLRVDANDYLENGLLVEFAYFRTPKIGKVDTSGSHGKILNEIHRLSLLKQFRNIENDRNYNDFSNYKCLLICVTDHVMLNYGQGTRGRRPLLIQDEYYLNNTNIELYAPIIRNKIQKKFRDKIIQLNIVPTATRLIDLHIPFQNTEWGIWAWEVNYQNL